MAFRGTHRQLLSEASHHNAGDLEAIGCPESRGDRRGWFSSDQAPTPRRAGERGGVSNLCHGLVMRVDRVLDISTVATCRARMMPEAFEDIEDGTLCALPSSARAAIFERGVRSARGGLGLMTSDRDDRARPSGSSIYHVMARGNARQKIVRDDADRRRLIDGLEQSVVRHGWDLLSYVVMGNHLYLMVTTPRPNLGAGMQSFLSGYAIWSGRRWRRQGHLFQGRYRAEMIEDESYYWTVSRYIHLNPVARAW